MKKKINNNDKELKAIRDNIKKIRESKNLSQEDVAHKMGMSQSKYARFESGRTKTDLNTLLDFLKIIDMDMMGFIGYPEKFINVREIGNSTEPEAILQIKFGRDKRDKLFNFLFNDDSMQIINNLK